LGVTGTTTVWSAHFTCSAGAPVEQSTEASEMCRAKLKITVHTVMFGEFLVYPAISHGRAHPLVFAQSPSNLSAARPRVFLSNALLTALQDKSLHIPGTSYDHEQWKFRAQRAAYQVVLLWPCKGDMGAFRLCDREVHLTKAESDNGGKQFALPLLDVVSQQPKSKPSKNSIMDLFFLVGERAWNEATRNKSDAGLIRFVKLWYTFHASEGFHKWPMIGFPG
jgi:hypothetical protein